MSTRYDPAWVREFYDTYGMKEWDRWECNRVSWAIHVHYLRKAIKSDDRVLEMGAGAGRFTQVLAEITSNITVADISPGQLEINEEQAKTLGFDHAVERWMECDVCDLTSDLARAAETADIIAQHLDIPPTRVTKLRELNNGTAANQTHEDAANIAIPISSPVIDWSPYPGAESWRTMCNRVFGFLDSLDRTQDLTLLVLHGNSGNAAICWWLGLGIGEHNIAFDLAPCSISHFAVNDWGERTVLKLNDTSHLAACSSAPHSAQDSQEEK